MEWGWLGLGWDVGAVLVELVVAIVGVVGAVPELAEGAVSAQGQH
jgi:hypothetical protein